jgi:hypothetical protein
MADAVRVTGLREFNRAIKRLDATAPKALRLALNDVADVVVRHARPLVPRRTGRAAASLRARSTRSKVRVAAGGKRAPYYPWLDFGGRVGRRKATKRAFLKEGRYLYRSYFENQDEFVDVLADRLRGTADRAGLRVTHGR